MATIVKMRELVNVEKFLHEFEWRDTPGAGFSFECDKEGNLIGELSELGRKNYEMCMADKGQRLIDNGVRDYSHTYWSPAILKCDCGRKVALEGSTNTCDCGADYNLGGQRLAPRSQWGEETGESVSDILQADSDVADYHWRQQIGEV